MPNGTGQMFAKGKMHFVYVLLSLKDKRFYIGLSNNLTRRIKEHKYGKGQSTKGRRPLVLLYYEAHASQKDAKRREKYFKTSKGRTTLKQILRDAIDNYVDIK